MRTMDRHLRFVVAQVTWMFGVLFGLVLLGTLTFELFFVLSFIGLLIVVELTATYAVRPRWRVRLWWMVLLGFVGFSYLITRRILSILPTGLL